MDVLFKQPVLVFFLHILCAVYMLDYVVVFLCVTIIISKSMRHLLYSVGQESPCISGSGSFIALGGEKYCVSAAKFHGEYFHELLAMHQHTNPPKIIFTGGAHDS